MSIRQLRTAAEATITEVRNAADVAAHAAALLREAGDEAGVEVAQQLVRSLPRTTATVVVAGEHKAGKSSLVNALLRARVVPADPLTTTPVPIRIVGAEELRIAGRIRVDVPDGGPDGEALVGVLGEEVLDRERYLDLLAEDQPELRGVPLDHLEVRMPSSVLDLGLTLVDTPSISGGITSAAAGVVLGEVASADALVFVSDASQELTAPELEFLRIAASLGTTVLVAVTKVDLYPEWRRLLDIDHDHLAAGLDVAPVAFPVSAALRRSATRYGDDVLDTESGVPLLLWYLVANVVTQARQRAIAAAGERLAEQLATAEDGVAASRRALSSAREQRVVQAQLEAAVARAARLDGQWQVHLRKELDRFQLDVEADLGERLQFVTRLMAQTIDAHDPATEWAVIESQFNGSVNRVAVAHLGFMQERARAVYAAMEDLLGVPAGTLSRGDPIQLEEPSIGVELDRPDLAIDAAGQVFVAGSSVSRYAWVAGAAVGAALNPFLGFAALWGAAAGLGVGGGAGAFARRRAKVAARDELRRRVRAQAQLDVAEAARAASLTSKAARSELHARLQDDLLAEVGALKARLAQEVLQLKRIADVAEEHRPAKDRELEALLGRIRLVRAHADRLPLRAERPLLEVPAR